MLTLNFITSYNRSLGVLTGTDDQSHSTFSSPALYIHGKPLRPYAIISIIIQYSVVLCVCLRCFYSLCLSLVKPLSVHKCHATWNAVYSVFMLFFCEVLCIFFVVYDLVVFALQYRLTFSTEILCLGVMCHLQMVSDTVL